MKLIHARYNPMHNSIDINHYDGYVLRIDCNQAESVIRTTPNSQRCLNALAIDNPLEYARLALDGEMQAWVDAEDCLEVFLQNIPPSYNKFIVLIQRGYRLIFYDAGKDEC